MALANPIWARVVSRRTWLSLRSTLWLAVSGGLCATGWAAWLFLDTQPVFIRRYFFVPSLMPLFGLLILPAAVAMVAVRLTLEEVHAEHYEILIATTLGDAAIVCGYVFSALYRVRAALAFAVSMLPIIVIGMLESDIHRALFMCGLDFGRGNTDGIYRLDYATCPQAKVEVGLAWLLVTLGVLGLNGLAASLGVALTLWRRHSFMYVVTPLIMLGLAFAPFWKLFAAEGIVQTMETLTVFNETIPLLSLKTFWLMLYPYLSAWALIWLAQRWVRTR